MHKIGIILGSGLNRFADELKHPDLVFEDKKGIHHKKVISGSICKKEVVVFQGRNHLYEGASLKKVLFNVKLAEELGIDFLIVTNAAGGLNQNYRVSDLMLISSHVNFLFKRISCNKSNNTYDIKLINEVIGLAGKNKILLHRGTYCSSLGPVYETMSDLTLLKKMHVDAVGMSTIPELIYANSNGIKTLAISCITNLLSSSNKMIISHDEVIDAGNKAYKNFSKLMKIIINDY